MKVSDLNKEDYHEFYQTYIDKLPGDKTLGSLLKENQEDLREVLSIITPEKLGFSYAAGKWTLAEVLQHMIDVERIFQYRALCIARNDRTSLPGFDHDAYVPESDANRRDLESLKTEFKNVRSSGIDLYMSFSEEMLQRKGMVNNNTTSAGAIGFITIGHTIHHLEHLKEKYLI
ncbi:MAG: DinB family protein [Salegentibacter sp.]|uniref:DinB superfamily protein n=1 Tax=Salegentibacter flavus TaxID=287099 RepID=A0A1I4Z545_9FLAO|nr:MULTISPECIES: DinB family protein [Salegentibacter]MDR9456188.1 DinB family protein [Salegentibacter sp.]SFN45395.1 DinB superfamily protein [Salegentibacter flavus]